MPGNYCVVASALACDQREVESLKNPSCLPWALLGGSLLSSKMLGNSSCLPWAPARFPSCRPNLARQPLRAAPSRRPGDSSTGGCRAAVWHEHHHWYPLRRLIGRRLLRPAVAASVVMELGRGAMEACESASSRPPRSRRPLALIEPERAAPRPSTISPMD